MSGANYSPHTLSERVAGLLQRNNVMHNTEDAIMHCFKKRRYTFVGARFIAPSWVADSGTRAR